MTLALNSARYIKWIQQIANEHWNSLTTNIHERALKRNEVKKELEELKRK